MKYAGDFGASQAGQSSIGYVDFDLSSQRGDPVAFTVSDAHLLFSGSYERHGRDLIISDQKHHLVVPNYFHGDKRPWLVSPDGAPLDSAIVDALTGHTQYAQAGGSPAGKVVGNIAKMTGSASIVRNGVTIDVQVGDAVYQSDVLQTGSSSTVGLVLVDGTAFNLSANARLMLNDLTFEEGSTSNSSFITLVQGAASFVAGQVAKTGDMKVATPAAVVGIRGTAVKLDIASTDGRVDISVIDQQDGQVHAVEVFKCVPTGVTDPQTGATCSAGDRIGTVTSNGPSLSVTPAPNFDVTVQQNNKTPAQIAQEFNVFQATIETYNIQKQINPNLPQHTENGGGNNSNTGTKYASLGSTPPDPPATDSFAEGKGLAVQALVTDLEIQAADTVPATGRVVTSVTVPAVSTSSSTANNAGTDSPLTLPLNTAAPQVTARLAFNTGTSTDIIASNNATLSGTGLANTAVNFTVDGSPIATTVMADANGVWSFTPSGLADGAHTIVASQTDGFGNTGAASLSFTLDTTAPSGGMPNLEASDTGSSSSDNITAATTPIFVALLSTSVVAGDFVELLLNGSPLPHPEKHLITSADVLAGRVSLAVTPGDLGADGSKEVATQFSDTAGNSSISSALSFTLDTLAPAAPAITSVTDDVLPVTGALTSGGSTNDTDLTVRVSLSGTNAVAGDTLQLYNGTGTSSQLGTSYTITSGDISNGFADVQTGALSNGATYTITARVTDQAGNQSTASGSFIITEAGTAPAAPAITSVTDDVLPVTGALTSGGSTNDTDLTVRVSLSGTNAVAGDTLQLYNGTGTSSQLGTSYTITSGDISNGFADVQTGALSNGATYTITARVTDQAGNQSTASGSFIITEAGTAPAAPAITSVTDDVLPVTGTVADNGFSNDATLTIAGTAEAGSTVTLYDTDGTTVLGTGVASGGAFSITTTALGQGSHTITAKATDTAGNQGAASTAYHVTIDTSAPAAPAITSVTDDVLPVTGTVADNGFSNDATLTIAGTAEAGSTVTLYDTDGTTVLGTGVASGGAFSITTTALGQGSHTITAKATDTAGNQGAASTAYHVTIDTSAPAAPAITSVTDDVLPVTGALTSGGSTNDTDLTVRVSLSGTNAVAGDTLQLYNGTGTSSQLGTSYTHHQSATSRTALPMSRPGR